jgi:hypothetical protein
MNSLREIRQILLPLLRTDLAEVKADAFWYRIHARDVGQSLCLTPERIEAIGPERLRMSTSLYHPASSPGKAKGRTWGR